MSLDQDTIKYVARLARLKIDESQTAQYQAELASILELVDQLESADTDHVAPMAHPLNMDQRLRADAVTESNRRSELQALAPAVSDGHFCVPKVIE